MVTRLFGAFEQSVKKSADRLETICRANFIENLEKRTRLHQFVIFSTINLVI